MINSARDAPMFLALVKPTFASRRVVLQLSVFGCRICDSFHERACENKHLNSFLHFHVLKKVHRFSTLFGLMHSSRPLA